MLQGRSTAGRAGARRSHFAAAAAPLFGRLRQMRGLLPAALREQLLLCTMYCCTLYRRFVSRRLQTRSLKQTNTQISWQYAREMHEARLARASTLPSRAARPPAARAPLRARAQPPLLGASSSSLPFRPCAPPLRALSDA